MDNMEAMTALKQFIIERGLPRTDISLFGVRCPYCGKSDRIRQLEAAQELEGMLADGDRQIYQGLWKSLTPNGEALGVCKFCLNPLRLNLDEGLAEPLHE